MPKSAFQITATEVLEGLAEHKRQILRIRCESMETVAKTQETIAQSRALMAEMDTVFGGHSGACFFVRVSAELGELKKDALSLARLMQFFARESNRGLTGDPRKNTHD
jgi:hypothetical protein